MNQPVAVAEEARPASSPSPPRPSSRKFPRRWILGAGGVVVVGVLGVVGANLWARSHSDAGESESRKQAEQVAAPPSAQPSAGVVLTDGQQRAIGLKTAKVGTEPSIEVFTAPGRVAPNEVQYAYITPRAAGVVRSVVARVGQDVKAGDLLATIDSPQVGEARLELYTKLQTLEVAQSQADWQSTIYENTLDLLDRLRKGELPETINTAFQDRPVGENRERLMTAYAQYHLGLAKFNRNSDLYKQNLITKKYFEEVNADYEVARSTYQGLMDQMGYEVRLANVRTQQALKQAKTAVRAAREHLRILGVKSDGTEPDVEKGKVVGVKPDGTLPATPPAKPAEADPDVILPKEPENVAHAVKPPGVKAPSDTGLEDAPVSTYSIWAPFDGTILDREMIVPGVAVDTAHRIFTLANLSTVWVEVSVHESDFGMLDRTPGGKIQLRSPAYPGRVFTGSVIYAGDLVEEKSRAIKLLARAENADRRLKPGMFVEVEILKPGTGTVASVPASAVLSDGSRNFVYVRKGPELFVRKEVVAEPVRGQSVNVREGLVPGEEVVVAGGAKIKWLATQLASAANE